MPRNTKPFLVASSVILGLVCVLPLSLLAAVPNMIGTWTITTTQTVVWNDFGNQSSTPSFSSGAPSSYTYITDQQGRTFAGYGLDGTTKRFFVGVIMPDNSISIQGGDPLDYMTGKYSVVNAKPTMKLCRQRGSRVTELPLPSAAFIESDYIEMKKTSSSVPADSF